MRQAKHIAQLFDLHDMDFVVAAYRSVLGREPDDEGLKHYTDRLRAGISRATMLHEISRSQEAKLFGAQIEGLPKLLKQAELSRVQRILRRLRRDPELPLNRIENALGRLDQAVRRLDPMLNHCVVRVDELRSDTSALQRALSDDTLHVRARSSRRPDGAAAQAGPWPLPRAAALLAVLGGSRPSADEVEEF